MTARHYGNLHKNLIRIVGAGKTLSKVFPSMKMTQTQCFRMSMSSSLKLQNLLIGLQKSQIHSVSTNRFSDFDGADFDGAEVHLF